MRERNDMLRFSKNACRLVLSHPPHGRSLYVKKDEIRLFRFLGITEFNLCVAFGLHTNIASVESRLFLPLPMFGFTGHQTAGCWMDILDGPNGVSDLVAMCSLLCVDVTLSILKLTDRSF